jgi:nucleotide-binding universal stress UspA family protein
MTSLTWQRILATTDFSPMANKAVDYAHVLAAKMGAELHVLHVARDVSDVAAVHGSTGTFDPADGADERRDWLGRMFGETSTRRVDAIQVGPDVSMKIADYARTNHIDLIVMATHGRTGLAHLALGSVAENVFRTAPCPVLVIGRASACS